MPEEQKPKRVKRENPNDVDVLWRGWFYEDADDASLDRAPQFKPMTRVKLTLEDAIAQGIVTDAGVDPRFTVIAPIRFGRDGLYMRVNRVKTQIDRRKNWIFYTLVNAPHPDDYPPVRLNPKARLHIIVNC